MHIPTRHLILGDGVIGRAAAQTLRARGHEVTLASRSARSEAGHLQLDALDAPALSRALHGHSHLHLCLGLDYRAQVWERDWPRIMLGAIDAALTHGARLLWFDNIYAYGPLPLAVPMREDHALAAPSRKGRVREGLIAQLQQAGEQRGLRWLIARSADFYGPHSRLSLLYVAGLQRQLQGRSAVWLGNADRRHSFTYTPDAGRALALLALDESAWQQSWHMPTASPAPTPRALLADSARLLGLAPRLHVLPAPLVRLASPLHPMVREVGEMLYQNQQDYVFCSDKFMARYPDFRITPYAEGLAATLASFAPAGKLAAA
ncbi:MAG: NAD-dependent epimerase/dehydratase family protein [Burkholderiales bacterium]|nr:NAD-dependent epimerase/dehydratase family protein [Burkholderiales bacterium]